MSSLNLLAFNFPMGAEWIVIAGLGLLIFGKRLPEVGKGIGQAIRQFKEGLKSVDNEPTTEQVEAEPAPKRLTDQTPPATAAEHKFDPYTGKPIEEPKFDPYTGKPLNEETAGSERPA